MAQHTIRPARPGDLERLVAIEIDAGRLFHNAGMPQVAGFPPPSTTDLAGAAALIVAVDDADVPIGYVRFEIIDSHGHLQQISVLRDYGRRGVGRALLDAAIEWAKARGDTELTLTTFRDVPWNAPWYQRCGFVALADHALPPSLERILTAEAAHGLDRTRRCAMRLKLQA